METVTFDYSNALTFFKEDEIYAFQGKVSSTHDQLHRQSLGWIDHPENYDRHEFLRIQKTAAEIILRREVLLVIGVGGSYLGARAAIEMLNHHFYNLLSKKTRKTPQIFYVGHNFNPVYIADLFQLLEGKDFSINVISKSGTTMEPAIAFRIFRNLLEDKYGKEGARKRIFVTTDRKKGLLKKMADTEGYETFPVPENIGGRYSVLTAVGLLPMAVGGIDVEEVMAGAAQARFDLGNPEISGNAAYQYAVIRNILYGKGKTIEILAYYEPCMKYFSEWWKQLFGESEGKKGKGIFPAAANFTADLHSIGQYIQEGRRDMFETVVRVGEPRHDVLMEAAADDQDDLNFLADRTLDFVNKQATEGTLLAHSDGGVPNLVIELPRIDAYTFGYLVYFFKKACAMSGLLHGVNPFDQPGVEMYKNNIFALLEKPGFEKRMEELKKRYLDTFEKV